MAKLSMLEWALEYLDRGLSVIPVRKDKQACINWKPYCEKLPTKSEVKTWWSQFPDANIAIITGKVSDLTVVDIEAGGEVDYLPPTRISKTGGGGYHYYYKYLPNFKNKVRIRHLTDIRNDGGYVIAPPSVHANGERYKWMSNAKLADFPLHLFVTEAVKQKENNWEEIFDGVNKGERNSTAAKLCGFLFNKIPFKLWEQVAWPALQSWNSRNEEPLNEKELRAVFDSIRERAEFNKEDSDREILKLDDLTKKYQEKIKELKDGKIKAITTGFPLLDTFLNGGWKSGELILLGARPSVGKTSLALSFAENAAKAGHSVLFFSIEMSSLDIYERLLSFITKLPCSEIIQGTAKKELLDEGFSKINKLNLSIAELASATSLEVVSVVKELVLEKKIDLIIVDYLQFLRDKIKSENSAARIGQISKNLKMLARLTGIPIIAPTQLNRRPEDRAGKAARLSDLRESGDLEQDADVVILIDREIDGDNKDKATLRLAKNRKGQTGEIYATFDLRTTKFLSNK